MFLSLGQGTAGHVSFKCLVKNNWIVDKLIFWNDFCT